MQTLIENPLIVKMDIEHILNYDEIKFNPQFYHPHYQRIENKIKSFNQYYVFQDLIKEINMGATPPGANYVEEGIPFLRGENLKNGSILYDNVKKISNVDHKTNNKRCQLKQDDLIISIVGELGIGAKFNSNISKEANINQDFCKIVLKKPTYASYIALFLNTNLNIQQSIQRSNGHGLLHLNLPAVKSLLIPIPEKENVIISFSQTYDFSNRFHYLAEALVEWIPEFTMDYLGIEMPEESDELCFTVGPEQFDEKYYYRCEPNFIKSILDFNKSLKNSDQIKLIMNIGDVKKKWFDPRDYPTKEFFFFEIKNLNRKTNVVEPTYRLGRDFTQQKIWVEKGEIIIGDRDSKRTVIYQVKEDNIIADKNIQIIRPNDRFGKYLLALWQTPFFQEQLKGLCWGKLKTLTTREVENIKIPVPPDQSVFDDIIRNYSTTNEILKKLYSISKTLLSLGTTLLERLIEAETDEEREYVESLLEEVAQSVHADIFTEDPDNLPEHYDQYVSEDEYQKLIKELPEDLQYDTFEDYKRAGKYIDPGKLEELEAEISRFAEKILPQEEGEETLKLLDLLVRLLESTPSDIPSLLKNLRKEYPDICKQYEPGLSDTVERALKNHPDKFEYDGNVNLWKMIDYKAIEEQNLQKEGKKRFKRYLREKEENSEARPPSQRMFLYAIVAFLREDDKEMAKKAADYIDVKNLGEEEKDIYWNYQWKLR